MNFKTLAISLTDGIALIELNRPDKANAMNGLMWNELKAAFDWLEESPARVGVLSARGRHFTAGIDLDFLLSMKSGIASLPEGNRQEHLREVITGLQHAVSAAETCRKPILAAVHGACIGAGVDLITACDMRYATHNARFSVKEVDMAIVADLGTLQRLPRLTGDGQARELAYTGMEFDGNKAYAIRLVNDVFPDQDSLMKAVMEIALCISRKSPSTIRGIKETFNYSRDHSVSEGLEYVAALNATLLFSDDLTEALTASKQKREPVFKD